MLAEACLAASFASTMQLMPPISCPRSGISCAVVLALVGLQIGAACSSRGADVADVDAPRRTSPVGWSSTARATSRTSAFAAAATCGRCCSCATRARKSLESRIDLKRPDVLQFEYLKHLFTSYLFRDPQQDVLIIGLGGGGMIHFLRHADPGVRIDAVEIDPLVVQLADKYFGVRSGENVNIITADGLKFIAETPRSSTT